MKQKQQLRLQFEISAYNSIIIIMTKPMEQPNVSRNVFNVSNAVQNKTMFDNKNKYQENLRIVVQEISRDLPSRGTLLYCFIALTASTLLS